MNQELQLKKEKFRAKERRSQMESQFEQNRIRQKQIETLSGQNFEELKQMYIRIGDYQYLEDRVIGSGSSSKVYSGEKIKDPRQKVAIKVIDVKEQGEERVDNEVMILRKVRSRYIIHLFATYKQEGKCYLIMELCDDCLSNRLGNVTQQDGLEYFKQILSGMEVLQKQNIIHRDLKLENILIKKNQIKIADFGFAKQLDRLTIESLKCGTPYTMAPEIFKADTSDNIQYSNKQDVWSLGVILHLLLYNQHPFNGIANDLLNNERVQIQQPDSLIWEFLNRTLEYNVQLRISWKDILKHPIRKYRLLDISEEETKQQPLPNRGIIQSIYCKLKSKLVTYFG